ncbi:hypothetical protein SEPCBS57363_005587 [Sporothrix epigloea]|uniref:Ars-binding protein n=1 Tax=Sporothrix epigloea TaxID=1892477 RepID=A0ABP0DYC4_9PEZI
MTIAEGLRSSMNDQGTVSSAILPDRTINAANIEGAYVSFILACNPAVSPSTDTAALREAFRTPPRSDGKSFSIFVLYQLICQLENREIKTWAELALKLGVEPPDQDKGQSSQKIQQYAVRLKRWMHSMHVDAFFDYLMDRPHPYWTQIPTVLYPLSEHLRDGVAAKDDMALRALVPEIKPRRGRRRPDDDEQDVYSGRSSPQRQRLDDHVDDLSIPDSAAGRWSAHSDGSSDTGFSHHHHHARFDMPGVVQSHVQTSPPVWSAGDNAMSPPLSAYQHSVIPPSTQITYRADETQSVTMPVLDQSSRKPGRRHGAKVVSSAWRSSGTGGSGKTRGRPPINRNGNHHTIPPTSTQDAAFSHLSASSPTAPINTANFSRGTNEQSTITASSGHGVVMISENLGPPTTLIQPHGLHPHDSSWQAPTQQMAEVLSQKYDPEALEHPVSFSFAQNSSGHHNQTPSLVDSQSPNGGINFDSGTTRATSAALELAPTDAANIQFEANYQHGDGENASEAVPKPQPVYSVQFGAGAPGDRTNIDEIEAFFMTEIIAATWLDENDQRIAPGSVEEASVLVDVVIEDLVKGASCKEAFLINLAALAGGKILMSDTETRIKRLERTSDYTKYDFSWELRFGDVCGQFSITEVVEHARWKKMTTDVKASVARAVGLKTEAEERAQQPIADLFSGITATKDGGRIRLPMHSSYEIAWPSVVPKVNPGLQRYASDGSADLNFGTPAGSQHSAVDQNIRNSITGSGTTPSGSTANAPDDVAELAAIWEKKYRHLLHLLYKRDRQLDRTRYAVLQGIRKTYEHDDTRDLG